MNHIIEVEDLTVSYAKTPVLWQVGFSLPGKQIIGIVGPNGAGKSTLLKSLLGIHKPAAGKIS